MFHVDLNSDFVVLIFFFFMALVFVLPSVYDLGIWCLGIYIHCTSFPVPSFAVFCNIMSTFVIWLLSVSLEIPQEFSDAFRYLYN